MHKISLYYHANPPVLCACSRCGNERPCTWGLDHAGPHPLCDDCMAEYLEIVSHAGPGEGRTMLACFARAIDQAPEGQIPQIVMAGYKAPQVDERIAEEITSQITEAAKRAGLECRRLDQEIRSELDHADAQARTN